MSSSDGAIERRAWGRERLRRTWLCAIVLCACAALFSGCIRQGVSLWDKLEKGKAATPAAKPDAKEGTKKEDQATAKLIKPKAAQDETGGGSSGEKTGEGKGKDVDRRSLPERERVRLAALDEAKELGSVIRLKICYVKEDDEWWAILYRDEGPIIDLKQFVWNRKTEKLEPFLVIRQIKKEELDSELRKKEPGKTCTLEDAVK
ncbi:MAG: hypothetical protein ACP5M0_15740 [Desulfomonilaceae bacterium]